VSVDRRLVSMSWTGGPDGVIRLDQWAANLDGLFAKTAPGARFTNVGQGFALWFDSPHEVVLLAPDGTKRTEAARLSGRTLIWQTSTATLRLEGDSPSNVPSRSRCQRGPGANQGSNQSRAEGNRPSSGGVAGVAGVGTATLRRSPCAYRGPCSSP
jgi:hypothetical protein